MKTCSTCKELKESSSFYKDKRTKERCKQCRIKNLEKCKQLRSRLYQALKNHYKSGSAIKDLGCTVDFLKKHIELQFQDGMSWDNYSEWHIDHIKPISTFDLTDRVELLKSCNYTNLQPLWKKDNLSKGNKMRGL